MIYYNGFRDIGVKFEKGKGYYFKGMSPWIETKVSEGLIESLPYYKVLENDEMPKRETNVLSKIMSAEDKILLMEKYNALS